MAIDSKTAGVSLGAVLASLPHEEQEAAKASTDELVAHVPMDWDSGFDAGYLAALNLAIGTCEERARKHKARGTRLSLDQQSEASACAFAIRKAAAKKVRRPPARASQPMDLARGE